MNANPIENASRLNHYGYPHCNADYYGSDSQSGTDTYKNELEMGHIAPDEPL
jgi:hypothetical protein